MAQNDKQQLLVKELCTRQPWGVKVQYNNKVYSIDYVSAEYKEVKLDILDNYTVGIFDVKPYLRPMSSMTEDEKSKFYDICTTLAEDKCHFIMEGFIDSNFMLEKFSYLDSIHVDYRGLIDMGLAIEVTKENNPYEDINL